MRMLIEGDLDTFVQLYFPDVHRRYSSGMDADQKLNKLLLYRWSETKDEIVDALLDHLDPNAVNAEIVKLGGVPRMKQKPAAPPVGEQLSDSRSAEVGPAVSPPRVRRAGVPHVVVLYNKNDEKHYELLDKYLRIYQRQNHLTYWAPENIFAGAEVEKEFADNLDRADMVLVLVSVDLLSSDMSNWLERAVRRRSAGLCSVVPVLLRPVDYRGYAIEGLRALPKDGRPVSRWPDADDAFSEIAEGVLEALRSGAAV